MAAGILANSTTAGKSLSAARLAVHAKGALPAIEAIEEIE
jgi:hypothetical protein